MFVFEVTLRFDSAIGESRVSTESERGSGRGSEMDVQAWRRWWWRGRAREEDQFQYHKLRATLLVCCSPLASPHACAESGWCMQRARASVHAGSVYGNRHAVHEKNREEDVDEENKRKTRLQVFCVSKVCVSLRHSNIQSRTLITVLGLSISIINVEPRPFSRELKGRTRTATLTFSSAMLSLDSKRSVVVSN